jgi:hypothetical protein
LLSTAFLLGTQRESGWLIRLALLAVMSGLSFCLFAFRRTRALGFRGGRSSLLVSRPAPADFLPMPPRAALRGSPMLQEWTLRKPKRLSVARTLDQKTQPYESLFSGSCHSARIEERSDRGGASSACHPDRSGGISLAPRLGGCKFEILFPEFSTPTANQTHPILPAQGDAKSAAPQNPRLNSGMNCSSGINLKS